jgi:hypothetical protein
MPPRNPVRLTAIQVEADKTPQGSITLRAVLLGLAISLGFSFLIPYIDLYLSDTFLGAQHLPPGAVFALFFLLVVVNPLLRLLNRRWPLTRVELLLIYCMLLFSTLVPGHGSENVFIPIVTMPFYYGSPENKFQDLFFRHIPEWFSPTDPKVILPFHEGLAPGQVLPWAAWWTPLLVWSIFVAFLYALVLALAVLFHRQWADGEKLSYPLVALPMEMTRDWSHPFDRGSFYANKVMWIGFAVAVLLQTQAGLKFYFPVFPGVPLQYDFTRWFQQGALTAFGWTPGFIWPCVVGITVLLRSEVSFSLWFFAWFTRLERLVAWLLGFRNYGQTTAWGEPHWLGFQTLGGYTAYVALAFWVARRNLGDAWRLAVSGARGTNLPISYRTALLLLAASSLGILIWCSAAGLSLWVAATQIIVYTILAVALTKVVAESGMLFVQTTYSWLDALNTLVGTRNVGARNLTVGMFIERNFMTDLRAFIMPSFSQSFKIADLGRVDQKRLLAAILPTILLASVVSYYMNLRLLYAYGAVNSNQWVAKWAGLGGFYILASWLRSPVSPGAPALGGMAAGALFTFWLTRMRQAFTWFPFHPVGFIMMQTYPMKTLWFSTLLGWIFKTVILRYGGIRGLVGAVPFFLGLTFGDFFAMVVWLVVDIINGKHQHFLMPG